MPTREHSASIAAVPTTEITDSSFGIARTMPRPSLASPAESPCASRSPTSSILTITPTTP